MTTSSLPVFDRLFADAVVPVSAGEHRRDHPPVEGGRWPVSVVAGGLTDANRAALAALMRQARDFAGEGHFLTGDPRAVHVTVRALEPYRDEATPEEPIVTEWCQALRRCAERTAPLTLQLTGVTLTASSVLAHLECIDDRPWRMQEHVADELGPLSWYESDFDRNIWYCSLMHFTTDIRDPAGLIDWVRAHRSLPAAHPVTLTSLDLVRFQYVADPSGTFMAPQTWASFPLTAAQG